MASEDRRLVEISRELEQLAGRLSALARETASAPLRLSPVLVRFVLSIRMMWSGQFEPGLGEPARNMLLALYAARLEQRHLTPTSLASAASVPLATAHRWLDTMVARDLIRRSEDPEDGRLVRLSLTPGAVAGIEAYLTAIFERRFLVP